VRRGQHANFRVKNLPGISSLMMIQHVDHAERSRYETYIRTETGRAGAIRDMQSFLTVFSNVSAAARDSYMAIMYSTNPDDPSYDSVLQSLDTRTNA
jgi:hypothetical protein